MRNKMTRLLFLSLSALVLCGTVPKMTASAAETESIVVIEEGENGHFYYTEQEVEKEVSASQEANVENRVIEPLSAIEEVNGSIQFSTLADLKELLAKSYDVYTRLIYVGEEDWVIEEDMMLPSNVYLHMGDKAVIIPEGVTLQTTTGSGFFSVGTLKVKGTLVINGGVKVSTALNIPGTVNVNLGSISLAGRATITGEENIVFHNEWCKIHWDYSVETLDGLKKAVDDATTCTKERYIYSINLYGNEELLIDESLEIPVNANFYTYGTVVVGENGQLTLNGGCGLYAPMIVKGTLCNKNNLYVGYRDGGSLTIAESGSYTGSGNMNISANEEADFQNALQGLDLSNFEVTTNSNEYGWSWSLRDVSGLTKLGTVTNLEWGHDYEGTDWNSELRKYTDWEIKEMPGNISWKTVEPDQGWATIKVYREGETVPYQTHNWSFGSTSIPEWRSIDSFCNDDPESGTYYFTVQSTGDYREYRSSDIAQSDTWTYVKPEEQIGVCTDLKWDTWPRFSWKLPDDACVDGYELQVQYAATENVEPYRINWSWSRYGEAGQSVTDRIGDYEMQGDGYYSFRVRALSSDITAKCNGEWSDWSEPYVLNGLVSGVESQLDNIAEEATTPAEIREAVQAMDTEELKSAMFADNSNSGVLEKIAELENAAGGAAAVDVSEDAAAFDASKITVVGANLNTPADAEESIALVIDKPERDDVISAAYNNAVAVKFSMDLNNVTDTENLEVPVRITLPVPATINPQFLVILHYHAADGTAEEIRPNISVVGNQYYATFVLTSFSDFVLTQFTDIFEDVVDNTYYEEAVRWAVSYGITNGHGSTTTFCPDLVCSRGQVVTFLWRAKGCPEPASLNNPFTDVKESDYYYKAVLWAVEQGITNGYGSNDIFNPDGECTRGQVATFMWRAEGKPANSGSNPFIDLENDFYYDAVLWAVEKGITNGYGEANTFCPNEKCNRAQIVTFLYRGMK